MMRSIRAPSILLSKSKPVMDGPDWVPDEESEHCAECKVKFTKLNRKHHCRNCGQVFCGPCTNFAHRIPQFDYTKEVRVCKECKEDLLHSQTETMMHAFDDVPRVKAPFEFQRFNHRHLRYINRAKINRPKIFGSRWTGKRVVAIVDKYFFVCSLKGTVRRVVPLETVEKVYQQDVVRSRKILFHDTKSSIDILLKYEDGELHFRVPQTDATGMRDAFAGTVQRIHEALTGKLIKSLKVPEDAKITEFVNTSVQMSCMEDAGRGPHYGKKFHGVCSHLLGEEERLGPGSLDRLLRGGVEKSKDLLTHMGVMDYRKKHKEEHWAGNELRDLFSKYEPIRLNTVSALLDRYQGREEELMEKTLRQYEPEVVVKREIEVLLKGAGKTEGEIEKLLEEHKQHETRLLHFLRHGESGSVAKQVPTASEMARDTSQYAMLRTKYTQGCHSSSRERTFDDPESVAVHSPQLIESPIADALFQQSIDPPDPASSVSSSSSVVERSKYSADVASESSKEDVPDSFADSTTVSTEELAFPLCDVGDGEKRNSLQFLRSQSQKSAPPGTSKQSRRSSQQLGGGGVPLAAKRSSNLNLSSSRPASLFGETFLTKNSSIKISKARQTPAECLLGDTLLVDDWASSLGTRKSDAGAAQLSGSFERGAVPPLALSRKSSESGKAAGTQPLSIAASLQQQQQHPHRGTSPRSPSIPHARRQSSGSFGQGGTPGRSPFCAVVAPRSLAQARDKSTPETPPAAAKTGSFGRPLFPHPSSAAGPSHVSWSQPLRLDNRSFPPLTSPRLLSRVPELARTLQLKPAFSRAPVPVDPSRLCDLEWLPKPMHHFAQTNDGYLVYKTQRGPCVLVASCEVTALDRWDAAKCAVPKMFCFFPQAKAGVTVPAGAIKSLPPLVAVHAMDRERAVFFCGFRLKALAARFQHWLLSVVVKREGQTRDTLLRQMLFAEQHLPGGTIPLADDHPRGKEGGRLAGPRGEQPGRGGAKEVSPLKTALLRAEWEAVSQSTKLLSTPGTTLSRAATGRADLAGSAAAKRSRSTGHSAPKDADQRRHRSRNPKPDAPPSTVNNSSFGPVRSGPAPTVSLVTAFPKPVRPSAGGPVLQPRASAAARGAAPPSSKSSPGGDAPLTAGDLRKLEASLNISCAAAPPPAKPVVEVFKDEAYTEVDSLASAAPCNNPGALGPKPYWYPAAQRVWDAHQKSASMAPSVASMVDLL
ncbi:Lateral signaling target protein 2-like protein [Diplonema papillatum]|nr:Lateral signaling target protein 2-like protein [Diplonema papillatum]